MSNDDNNFDEESDATELLGEELVDIIDGALLEPLNIDEDETSRAVVSDRRLGSAIGDKLATDHFSKREADEVADRLGQPLTTDDGPTHELNRDRMRAMLDRGRRQNAAADSGERPAAGRPPSTPDDGERSRPNLPPPPAQVRDSGDPSQPNIRRPGDSGERSQPNLPRPANDSLLLDAPDLVDDDYEDETDIVSAAAAAAAIAQRIASLQASARDSGTVPAPGVYESNERPVPHQDGAPPTDIVFADEVAHVADQLAIETGRNPLGARMTGDHARPSADTGERLNRAIERVSGMRKPREDGNLRNLRDKQVNRQIWPDAPEKEVEAEPEVERPWTAGRSAMLSAAATVMALVLVSLIVMMAWFDMVTAVAVYIALWAAPAIGISAWMHRDARKRALVPTFVVLLGALPLGAWALPQVRTVAVGLIAPEVSEQHAGRIFMDPNRGVVFAACEEISNHIDFRGQLQAMGKQAPRLAVECARRIVPDERRRRALTGLADNWARAIRLARSCEEVSTEIEAYMETRAWDDHQDTRGALLTALNTESAEVRDCAVDVLAAKLGGKPTTALGSPEDASVFDEGLFAYLAQHAFVNSKESNELKLSSNAMQLWTMSFGCQALLTSDDPRELTDRMNGMARTVAERQDFWVNSSTWARWCIEFDGKMTKEKIRENVENSLTEDAVFVARGLIKKAIYQRERRFLTDQVERGFAIASSAGARLTDFSSFEQPPGTPRVFEGGNPMDSMLAMSGQDGLEFAAMTNGNESFCQLARLRLQAGRQPPKEVADMDIEGLPTGEAKEGDKGDKGADTPEDAEIMDPNAGFADEAERKMYEKRAREECGPEIFEGIGDDEESPKQGKKKRR